MIPLARLRHEPVLGELARRRVQLLAAVQPNDRDDALALVERARELGLSIGLWPLLEDHDGRWLHPGNAPRFLAFVDALLEALDRRGLTLDTLALDLEPPIVELRRLVDGQLARLGALPRALDAAPLARLTTELARRDVETLAAVIPPVVLEGRGGRGWQRLLATPLGAVRFDAVSAMLYSTLFEGYSRGLVRRADSRALLAALAIETSRRFGARASVSLGCVGVGALGDERTYRDARELADDVALARAAGIDDLALFDLAGVLARPPIEPWLDALTDALPSTETPSTRRARLALRALTLAGRALDRLHD
jgi:hypothetical protein